jgi:predicted GNAT family acetyltransferase
MVSSFRAGVITVDRLGPADLVESFAFLDRDPVANVYLVALLLRDALGRPRDEYWAARRHGEMLGFLHLGGQSGAVLPLGEDEEALRLLGEQARLRLSHLPRRFQVIGPADAVAPFLQRFVLTAAEPRLDRAQQYLVLEAGALAPFERLPDLTPASAADEPLVAESGARLRLEELDEDPRDVDAAGYRRRVTEECRDGHTYLWKDEGGLRFRASVSAITADAAQISGVYTPPERRRRGYALRGLSELCERLLPRTRAACLFVNDINAPALSLYRRMGFRRHLAWRSLFYDVAR